MTPIAFTPGRCCVPDCPGTPRDTAICTRCWFDLTDDERAGVRLASESPFDAELRLVEMSLALATAATALFKRRRRKSAERRLKQIRAAQRARAA